MLSPNDAAKRVGKSKSTILRDIRKGKLSAARGDDKSYQIDPSELARVYGGDAPDAEQDPRHDAPRSTRGAPSDPPESDPNVVVLQVKLDASEKIAAVHERTIGDLRDRLDKSEQERSEAQTKLTAILTDQRLITPTPRPAKPKGQNHAALALVAVLFAGVIWWFIKL